MKKEKRKPGAKFRQNKQTSNEIKIYGRFFFRDTKKNQDDMTEPGP